MIDSTLQALFDDMPNFEAKLRDRFGRKRKQFFRILNDTKSKTYKSLKDGRYYILNSLFTLVFTENIKLITILNPDPDPLRDRIVKKQLKRTDLTLEIILRNYLAKYSRTGIKNNIIIKKE